MPDIAQALNPFPATSAAPKAQAKAQTTDSGFQAKLDAANQSAQQQASADNDTEATASSNSSSKTKDASPNADEPGKAAQAPAGDDTKPDEAGPVVPQVQVDVTPIAPAISLVSDTPQPAGQEQQDIAPAIVEAAPLEAAAAETVPAAQPAAGATATSAPSATPAPAVATPDTQNIADAARVETTASAPAPGATPVHPLAKPTVATKGETVTLEKTPAPSAAADAKTPADAPAANPKTPVDISAAKPATGETPVVAAQTEPRTPKSNDTPAAETGAVTAKQIAHAAQAAKQNAETEAPAQKSEHPAASKVVQPSKSNNATPGEPIPAAKPAAGEPNANDTVSRADAANTNASKAVASTEKPATVAPPAQPQTIQTPAETPASGVSLPPQQKQPLGFALVHAQMNGPRLALAPEQIAAAITRHQVAGVDRFEIRLDPPELGRIDVRLEMTAGGDTKAHLSAERPETLDLLQRDARVLERALNTAGLKTERENLSFSLFSDNASGRENGAERQAASRIPGFLRGNEMEHGEETLPAQLYARITDPSRLDITI